MRGFGEKYESKKKTRKRIDEDTKSNQENLIRKAIQFHREGNLTEASEYYQYLISQELEDYRIFSNYGVILQSIGNLKEAEKLYRKAIKLNPNLAEAHNNLGNIFREFGELEKAEIFTLKAIELNPGLVEAYSNMGAILMKNFNRLEEAEIFTRKAIEINPNFANAHSNLGNILRELGNIENAELSLRKAIEINPNFAEAYSNLGRIMKDLGKLTDAEIFTRKAIEINPNFANAHSNLGNILRELGNIENAELSLRKAIEINPNFAEAYSNLGRIMKDLGKLTDAEILTRKAIKINPNLAEAYFNLGNILIDLKKLKQAEIFTRKAIEINPNFANAYLNLGNILSHLDEIEETFNCYIKANELNSKLPNIYKYITRFLRESDLSKLNESKLKNILHILMERNDISHQDLFKAFNFLYSNEIINNLKIFEEDLHKGSLLKLLTNDKLIINALKRIVFRDIRLEKILTKIRKNFSREIAENKASLNLLELQFLIALGEQCFLNEYVYSYTEEEKISIHKIINRSLYGEINETNIAILSCYYPLYKLLDKIPALKSFNSSNLNIKELIKLQLVEPLKEIELSKSIKSLGQINDSISKQVKSQYEENPYPRWRYGNSGSQKIDFAQVINNEIDPNNISKPLFDDQLKILIAGCGTGNQIFQAQRYENAQIIAIDLSLSSLSYAQRKINEFNLDNTELIQMDILETSLLKKEFDIIECSGVLHHMNDPSTALQTLLNVLKPNGFLKLGLYSQLARQHIVKARQYISSKKLQANEIDIRHFRETISSGKVPKLNSITQSPDFYTLSSCRDLCFHTQEHRFTIKQLNEILQSNQLKFLGFLLQQPIKSLYWKYFPEDKRQNNLKNWEKFEEKYPTTFGAMYQFWVSKISP